MSASAKRAANGKGTPGEGKAPYEMIRDCLREEIARYEYGDLLPGEQALAERFGVNRHTVRHAVEELMAEGLVVRQHGRGVMVTRSRLSYIVDPTKGITQCLAEQGVELKTRLLTRSIAEAPDEVAEELKLRRRQQVIRLDVLRCVDSRPLNVATTYLAATRWERAMRDYRGGSLHTWLKTNADLELRRVYSVIAARLPDEDEAQRLQIARTCPIFAVRSLNADATTGAPVELAYTRTRSDSMEIVLPFLKSSTDS
jgi:GntR family phosphonate transport system transcriptional regulator